MRNGSYYVANEELLSILQQQTQQNPDFPSHKVAFYKADSGTEIEITGDVFQQLVSMHKGKVIYIDFWATWCGPCKMEVPFAMDLHDFYKEKPIVFVNLCLFSDRNTWRKMVATQKVGGENYFFDKDQSELLKSKLKIGGFPTYMIISKECKLVDAQAPRPSSRNVIRQHLSKFME
ncbi:TlpA family protein disulfide reductase [Dyadobacter alkalitolerans]|uniref:TlpA family protein disulfide reductase n=1 Tax=Dyadobacter alkalitolerans TaxID=492736 RepID=UPI00041EF97D|nr:TlpA disulfide reductase family protein [Dyadobacter alkalitolerans]